MELALINVPLSSHKASNYLLMSLQAEKKTPFKKLENPEAVDLP